MFNKELFLALKGKTVEIILTGGHHSIIGGVVDCDYGV